MKQTQIINHLIQNFKDLTSTTWHPSNELLEKIAEYLALFEEQLFQSIDTINDNLLRLINERLEINKSIYRNFIDRTAKKGIIFNYHQKIEICEVINKPQINFINWYIENIGNHKNLIRFLEEVQQKKNTKFIALDNYLRDDPKKSTIIESIFCSYVYSWFSEDKVHKALNPDCRNQYIEDYWAHLNQFHRLQMSREQGLVIVNLDEIISQDISYTDHLEIIFTLIVETYHKLSNHCYLAIIISDDIKQKWQLISEITIFSEKFLEYPINKSYFRWQKIQKDTLNYIENINQDDCHFEKGNEGFTYKDCYLTYEEDFERCILLFEKNERDERKISCPKCRTLQVQGNSYPVLGVRSWECKNIFCGHKSKYNRGKRYSLASIIKQEAILNNDNLIEKKLLKKWRKDIVKVTSLKEIYEFLIKFYSLFGDTILIYQNQENLSYTLFSRYIQDINFSETIVKDNKNKWVNHYKSLSFFKRFLVDKNKKNTTDLKNLSNVDELFLYHGDAFTTLCELDSNSLGGAVTSPPYYNAKEYSQWNNMYCYLYDMYNIIKELYRCLKKGSPFILNIFDYFDNESIIVFSGMGKKRLILSSYMSFICRYVGLTQLGNIAWDKGEIEGNRNFNQGNYSPYYQAPLNCWEHLLIFSKGIPSFPVSELPKIIQEKPIFKIIKGKNTYGHSAPFPEAIPKLLLSMISKEETIIDPFSGSMTTGRVAVKNALKSINIELHLEYCQLGLQLLKNERHVKPDLQQIQLSLFD